MKNKRYKLAPSAQILIVMICMGILFAIVSSLYSSFYINVDFMIYSICLFLVGFFLFALWSWRKVTGGMFDPYTVFLVAAMSFNGGLAVLYVLNLIERQLFVVEFSPETVLRTFLLVLASLFSMHLGALVAALRGRKGSSAVDRKQSMRQMNTKETRAVGWVLLGISVVPMLFILKEAAEIVMTFGYFGLYQQEQVTGFEAGPRVLATFLIPGALFLLAGSESNRTRLAVSGGTIVCYGLMLIFMGLRGWGSLAIISFVWVWDRSVKPIPKSLLLGFGGILVLVVFPLIGGIRILSGVERLSLKFLFDAIISLENPIVFAISEMGGSIWTVAHTLELVPATRDFDLGKIHPTIERGLMSSWLTWTANPIMAQRGGGMGFSFIAEAYANFGWYGTPFFLFCIGFAFAKLVLWADRVDHAARIAMIASFLAFFPFFARGESAQIVRALLWYSFLPYACVHVVSSYRGRKSSIGNLSARNQGLNHRNEEGRY
jgi:oligosaccharide repeat unit polymerase